MKKPELICVGIIFLCASIHAQISACIPPPDGLVAWWRGEGNSLDSSGTNDGAIVAGVSFPAARVGSGLGFSGRGDDYVKLPANLFPVPEDGYGTTPFSFELWFKTSKHGVILGQQDTEPFLPPLYGYVPALYVGTNGYLHASMFWSDSDQLVSGATVNDGQFHHAAVTYDGTTQALYVDGVVQASVPWLQQGYASTNIYQLGTGWTDAWPETPGGWFPFAGIIDEVSVYGRALNAAEIAEIFNSAGGKCAPSGPVLRHRYSFDHPAGATTLTDAQRGANGVLLFASNNSPYTNGIPDGSGFTGSGALDLRGGNGYVQLPSGLISSLSSLTIEAWVSWNGPLTSTWQRILDFGFNDVGINRSGIGTNYLILCPARGGTQQFGFEQTTVNPFDSVQDPQSLILNAPSELPVGREVYLAATYDPVAGSAHLYLDGVLVNSASGTFNPLSEIRDRHCWLGRSQWQRDPFFNGQYNELRIWEGVVPPEEIASHYNAGPNQPIVALRPRLYLNVSGQSATLWWFANASGFQLETSSDISAATWQPVTNSITLFNNRYQVTLPTTAAKAFYRLRQ